MNWRILTDLFAGVVFLYAFTVCVRHVFGGRGATRAIGVVAAVLLVPALAAIHWYARWDLSATSPLNDPSRWWVIRVDGPGGQPAWTLNLVVAAVIFSVLYAGATALVAALASWHNRARGGHIQALHQGLGKWLLVATGLLVYLKAVGFSLTPLLFGMGAASIVVGLALQEPLSNLFAGLALDMEGAIEQGDWVRVDVDGGTVGRVIDKGWRTTRLLTLEQELVTLPNRLVGGQKIVNFQRPEPQHAHTLR
ncbi:MAG: mechanosensitive ion channel, partial [Proteobacteria bacterium]|nr:mechanosensitive ion channel [Pseudomonadota bacterium]